MGLLRRIFGGEARSGDDGQAAPPAADTTLQPGGADGDRRRDLIQLVLRDTMRTHAVPSDWIDCRILSIAGGQQAGMYVQLIIRQGEAQLLEYVHPLQDTFWKSLERFESRARDWLLSVSWEFAGQRAVGVAAVAPQAHTAGWDVDTQVPEQETQPPDEHADQLASDLQALFAIRDAALSDAAASPSPSPDDTARAPVAPRR